MLGDPSIVHNIMLFFTPLNAKENSSITINISMVLFANGCWNVIVIHNTMIIDVNMILLRKFVTETANVLQIFTKLEYH
jgi:hypothetical protein